MKRVVLLVAVFFLACTNDYGAFRYPKKRPGGTGGSGGTEAAAPIRDAGQD